MKKLMIATLALGTIAILGLAGNAIAIPTIDGHFDLAEWAGHYSEDNTPDYVYKVDPGYGGQNYDVEYLGLIIESTDLYFGMMTGYNLKTQIGSEGQTLWSAGDFALDIGSNGTYDFALDFAIASDNTVNLTAVNMAGASLVGFDDNPTNLAWRDVRYSQHTIASPFEATHTDKIGTFANIDYYTATGESGYGGMFGAQLDPIYDEQSYALEGKLQLTDLLSLNNTLSIQDFNNVTIHWTMGCGNDYLNHPEPIPEPATMLLFGTGLVGLAGAYRRKKK